MRPNLKENLGSRAFPDRPKNLLGAGTAGIPVLRMSPEGREQSYYYYMVLAIANALKERQNLCTINKDNSITLDATIEEVFVTSIAQEFNDVHPEVYISAVNAGLTGKYNRVPLKLYVDIAILGSWCRNFIFDLAKQHDDSNELANTQFWYHLRSGSPAGSQWEKVMKKIRNSSWLYSFENYERSRSNFFIQK
jgi:hypothetical protein